MTSIDGLSFRLASKVASVMCKISGAVSDHGVSTSFSFAAFSVGLKLIFTKILIIITTNKGCKKSILSVPLISPANKVKKYVKPGHFLYQADTKIPRSNPY